MGLDIVAYRSVAYRADTSEDSEDDEGAYIAPDFPGRADDVRGGVPFDSAEARHFLAGSYIGYGNWRRQLANLIGTSPEAVWANPTPGPFMELIHFTDCEGCIGATVSAKLAADFAAHQEQADAHADEWFRRTYSEFRLAFEMAAEGGLVQFR